MSVSLMVSACNYTFGHNVSLLCNLKSPCAKQATEPDRPQAAGRRPRRAAANTTKSYKERDSDDSLSELETVLHPNPSASLYFYCS